MIKICHLFFSLSHLNEHNTPQPAHFTRARGPYDSSPAARCGGQQAVAPRITEPVAWHHVSCGAILPASCFFCPSSPSRRFNIIYFMYFNQNTKGHFWFFESLSLTHSSSSGIASMNSLQWGNRISHPSFFFFVELSLTRHGRSNSAAGLTNHHFEA